MINQSSANVVMDAVQNVRGAAVDFSGEQVTGDSGYLVAIDGLGTVVRLEGLTAVNMQSLVNSLIRKVDGLADPATHGILVTESHGDVYVDVAKRFDDPDAAARRAEQNENAYVWDVASGRAVFVPETA